MHRLVGVILAGALGLAATPAAAAPPACQDPHSWVGGTTDLCQGAIVYRDYVDDDYGADTGSVDTTSRSADLAPSAGDQSYPTGEDATADLIHLTLSIQGDKLVVSGLLNALYHPDSTILAVAIDSDGNQATGGGKWGALDVSSKGWDKIAYFKTGDIAANVISGTMPLPSGNHWRVQAVTAIASSGQVMNVAFRGPDETASAQGVGRTSDQGSWFEDKQAAALGTGDISQFGYDVDVADLRNAVSRQQGVSPGLHERVYRSAYTVPPLNEGVDVAGVPGRGNGGNGVPLGFEQTFQYLGHYQPYGIYVPKKPGPHGMQMLFHGSGSVMSGLVNQPGMQQRFGEELNRVLVVPEARGQNGFGSDISERDLLDVMDDVQANYPIDKEHVFSGGYSQGGYITYRMAELYPDRFAGAVDWVGFTGNDENGTPAESGGYTAGAVGNVIDFVGNLRSVPTVMLYAGADELVHANTAVAMDDAFKASDDVFTFYTHPVAEHLTFAALDDWRKEAADTAKLSLIHDPPRVTYRTAAFLDDSAHGIVHDHAYWVSKIVGRQNAYEDVDLTTFACGGSVPVTESGSGSGSDPVPWKSDFHNQTGTRALDRRDAIEGTLANVASLTVDAKATCLSGKTLSYKLTTDGPLAVTFSDGRTLRFDKAGTYTGTLGAAAPAACASKRTIHVHVRRPAGMRVRTLSVFVAGKRRLVLKRPHGRRILVSTSLRGQRKGVVRVTFVLRGTRHGKRSVVRVTHRYHTCVRGRHKH
jgi:dienelactone hydrolase